MKKILITGATGYIGPYLCNRLAADIADGTELDVTVVCNKHEMTFPGANVIKCDLLQLDEIDRMFAHVKPDIVYHLASGTPTRILGEKDDYVRSFNHGVTKKIAELCAASNALLIYTSTDLVYDESDNIIEDNAKLNPLTIYALTKHEGEEAIRESGCRHVILRTALVYGFTQSSYTSFFDVAYSTLAEGKEQRAFADQFRCPIYVEDAAKILSRIPNLYKKNDVINFCGAEYLSRYNMCRVMCEIFHFDRSKLIPSSCNEFTAYPMVKRLGLNNNKLRSYGLTTSPFRENLIRALNFRPR